VSGLEEGAGSGLAIDEVADGDEAVLTVAGELDLDSAPRLRRRLQETMAAGRVHMVVDLAALSFIDSTGISVLVEVHKDACRRGGGLVVRSPSPAVRRLLEVTGLLAMFGLSGAP